jgi:hypothetical protein
LTDVKIAQISVNKNTRMKLKKKTKYNGGMEKKRIGVIEKKKTACEAPY